MSICFRALLATVATVTALTACQHQSPIINQDASMDIDSLPTLKQTQVQMLDLIDRVRARISATAPAAAGWHWTDEWSGSGCAGDGVDGVRLYFPNLTSAHGLTTQQWDQLFPDMKQLAADAGLTEIAMPQNSDINHDARFSSADGRQLIIGSSQATVITATIACRREGSDPLIVDGEIPMPPDPAP